MRLNVTRSMWASLVFGAIALGPARLLAFQPAAEGMERHAGGEANLVLPDLGSVTFLGIDGHTLLMVGLIVCALGLVFGLVIYSQLKNMPVHGSMLEISELIYETCKTYLLQQGKFLLILELFIGTIIAVYFGALQHFPAAKVAIILLFSLIGIGGSYGVAWFGIRVNTFANSRTAFASLARQAVSLLRDPAEGRHEHRDDAHQRRAAADALHPALHPGRLRGPVLHRLRHRRVARRGGAPHRRRHLHEDRRHRRPT